MISSVRPKLSSLVVVVVVVVSSFAVEIDLCLLSVIMQTKGAGASKRRRSARIGSLGQRISI